MKKVVLIVVTALAVIAVAGVIAFHSISAKGAAHTKGVSQQSAKSLQQKIDAIKKASETPSHKRGSSRVELSEGELESYVVYSLKEDIPAQIDMIDVQL